MTLKALDVLARIDQGYDDQPPEEPRAYIGASIVGHACDAMLAFNLRGFPADAPAPRSKRIFRLGHLLEDEVVADLKLRADVRVWEKDAFTGRQHRYERMGGHVVCHMDGHLQLSDSDEEVMVLEVKSMNEASWKKFEKHGVKVSHPQYYAQLQMMMDMSGFEHAFFIAINKNTSAYHAQIVEADPFEQGFLRERVDRALESRAAKVSDDPEDWRCRGCFKKGVCWEGKPVPKTCRTCSWAAPADDGTWFCSKHEHTAVNACGDYDLYVPEAKP